MQQTSGTKSKYLRLAKILLPYFLLFYLSIWQAFSLLKLEQESSTKLLWVAISAFAFYLLLIRINQSLFKVVLSFSLLLSIGVYPVLKIYGFPDKNFLASTLYTNTDEAYSYLKVVPRKVFITLGLLIIYTLGLLFLKFKKPKNNFLISFLIIILFIPVINYWFSDKKQEYKDFDQTYLDINYTVVPIIKTSLVISIGTKQIIQTHKDILSKALQPDSWEILNQSEINLKKNIIIVIGESVRKDFLHCYGFPMETTPFIDQSTRIQFENYLSVGAYTVTSLSRTLVRSDSFPAFKLADNLINLAKKVGYETYFLSNQGYIGIFDSPISIIAQSSNHYYKFTGGDFHTAKLDREMLPVITNIIQTDTNPKIIFVHMIGSHPDIKDRTNGYYAEYIKNKEISYYVQTIRNTDSFLSVIHQQLSATQEDFGMIYFSDHGLKLNKDLLFVHGAHIKEGHEVPLLIWGNDINETIHINAFRSGKHFPKLFCELYGIKTSNLNSKFSFISETEPDSSIFTTIDEEGVLGDYRNFESNPLPELR